MPINKLWLRGILSALVTIIIVQLFGGSGNTQAPLVTSKAVPKQANDIKKNPVEQKKPSRIAAPATSGRATENVSASTPEEILATAEPSDEGFKKMQNLAKKVGGLIAISDVEAGYSDEALRAQTELMKKFESKGYVEVGIGSLPSLSEEASGVSSWKSKKATLSTTLKEAKLTFNPTPLAESPLFNEAKYLGGKTTGSLVGDRWSGVAHYFEFADLGTVRLMEYESGPGGYTKFVTPEGLNDQVQGNPATYQLSVEPNGAGQAELDWTSGNHFYEMTAASQNAVEAEPMIRQRLLALAHSLHLPATTK
ncbi:hypothetical protein [Methyloglobulus sp.]|uniref:hypothetical protein n=1 Tax=Methyloglobulus sp. TaxID=2518622 RepID=UPI0032B70EC8